MKISLLIFSSVKQSNKMKLLPHLLMYCTLFKVSICVEQLQKLFAPCMFENEERSSPVLIVGGTLGVGSPVMRLQCKEKCAESSYRLCILFFVVVLVHTIFTILGTTASISALNNRSHTLLCIISKYCYSCPTEAKCSHAAC